MKKLQLTISVIISLISISCVIPPPEIALQPEDTKRVYTHRYSKTALELKEASIAFLSEYAATKESVIQISDGNIITGTYAIYVGRWDILPIYADIALMIKCTDGVLSYKITVKKYFYQNAIIEDKYAGNYREKTLQEFDSFDTSLSKYVESYISF